MKHQASVSKAEEDSFIPFQQTLYSDQKMRHSFSPAGQFNQSQSTFWYVESLTEPQNVEETRSGECVNFHSDSNLSRGSRFI